MHLGMHSQVFDQMVARSTCCPASCYFFKIFIFLLCLVGHILCNMYTGASFFLMIALEYNMLEWLYCNLFKGILEKHLNCFQGFCYNKYCAMTTEFLCCCYSCARIFIG